MAGTLISGNSTIKISAAVSNSISSGASSSATLYTCPANSYALVQLACSAFGANGTFTVGGRVICTFAAVSATPIWAYVGPSQVVQVSSSGAANTGTISGVEFINTP